MNSDTAETAEQIAKDADAIVKCWACGSYYVYADDSEADRIVAHPVPWTQVCLTRRA